MPIPSREGREVWDNLEPHHKDNILDAPERYGLIARIEDFTCADCPDVTRCEYSYDLYNLDGACLAEK